MIILCIKTDQAESELVLFNDYIKLAEVKWLAHRQLANTIHIKINELLQNQGLSFNDIQGIVVYKGPGSFTGLRIGITVANTFAYALNIPIVGQNSDSWLKKGIADLLSGKNQKIVMPKYGGEANVTLPKK